jgi:hypothetical protein
VPQPPNLVSGTSRTHLGARQTARDAEAPLSGRTSRNWLVLCSRCQPVEIPVAMTASTAASPVTQMMQIETRAIVRLLCVAYSSEARHRIS